MPLTLGSVVDLDIEKPVAGGRMLARHHGQVVLVWGAIPGERVRARIDRPSRSVAFATTVEVLLASPDRRAATGDWRCGGNVYAHIAYPRQQPLKAEVIVDALARIGRITLPTIPQVMGSPEAGYRMRARLHVRDSRVGFFREESHEICDVGPTGQFLPETTVWIGRLQEHVRSGRVRGIASVEIAENVAATERVCHLEVGREAELGELTTLAEEGGLTGLTLSRTGWAEETSFTGGIDTLTGVSIVTDEVRVSGDSEVRSVRLRRDVRAFFQGNRFLLEPLVRHVLSLVPSGPVVDLYAGVGLFGLSVAAAGGDHVVLVEGDSVSGTNLRENAEPFGDRVDVRQTSVERFLQSAAPVAGATFIVDPPRTGLSREAVAGIVACRPSRIVFVSCDPATFARDVRALAEGGYALDGLAGFDLFPNTAHVEIVGVLNARLLRVEPLG